MDNNILCLCDNIEFNYGKNQVLKRCSLTLEKSKLTALIGENGSGKTTMLKCILNLLKVKKGHITIKGKIGYCPQENYLFQRYTVMEHLELIASIDSKKNTDNTYLNELLQKFRLLKYKDTLIGKLSGGTYQKLKFITSLLTKPNLIILDEPYDGFDWEMYRMFWEIIETLKADGCGILIVSHFVHDFDKFDKIYQIKEGITYSEK